MTEGEEGDDDEEIDDDSDDDDDDAVGKKWRYNDLEGITWKNVGTVLDHFFFLLFVIGTVIISVFFLIPLASSA